MEEPRSLCIFCGEPHTTIYQLCPVCEDKAKRLKERR
jgi:predicted amidophosphoribosyltransferase